MELNDEPKMATPRELLSEMKHELNAKEHARITAGKVFGNAESKAQVFNFCRGFSSTQTVLAGIFSSFEGGGKVDLSVAAGFDATRYQWFLALIAMYTYGFEKELLTHEERIEAENWLKR